MTLLLLSLLVLLAALVLVAASLPALVARLLRPLLGLPLLLLLLLRRFLALLSRLLLLLLLRYLLLALLHLTGLARGKVLLLRLLLRSRLLLALIRLLTLLPERVLLLRLLLCRGLLPLVHLLLTRLPCRHLLLLHLLLLDLLLLSLLLLDSLLLPILLLLHLLLLLLHLLLPISLLTALRPRLSLVLLRLLRLLRLLCLLCLRGLRLRPLIPEILRRDGGLLGAPGIAIARVLPLIGRQRRGGGRGRAIPSIPAAATRLPRSAPALAPAGRVIGGPAAEVRGSVPVVAHRNAQEIGRHVHRIHHLPRPVVPGARVPVVAVEDPIQAVVEEVVRAHSRRVVHGIAWNLLQRGISAEVDADVHARTSEVHAELGGGGRDGAEEYPECE